MERIRVNASAVYDVVIGSGILDKCGELTREVTAPCRVCIISDDAVAKLYLDTVKKSFEKSGFEVIEYVFKNGEASKNISTLTDMLEFLAENHLTRSDIIAALGGGVTGDMAGFAAAVYLRGIKFVQLPTTFLAAIDSSVGGKTGVNLNAGKNLAGAFHQPSLVVCDTDCFKTLTREIFLDGVAEAVKYAVLKDKEITKLIDTDIAETVRRCVGIKRDVVADDEFDTGSRQFLNLGHTLGHSIEKLSSFKITHGHAVAIGMVLASGGGEKEGITEKGTTAEIIDILKGFGLPVSCSYSAAELASVALGDKKRSGNTITLVIPERIGSCKLCKTDVAKLEEFASAGLEYGGQS
ncbi:MAG: 3-dehydroquinate synthase [Clostridia bacterium]|nr:3-dehydroquinate synthase [Clostridia bacterium]